MCHCWHDQRSRYMRLCFCVHAPRHTGHAAPRGQGRGSLHLREAEHIPAQHQHRHLLLLPQTVGTRWVLCAEVAATAQHSEGSIPRSRRCSAHTRPPVCQYILHVLIDIWAGHIAQCEGCDQHAHVPCIPASDLWSDPDNDHEAAAANNNGQQHPQEQQPQQQGNGDAGPRQRNTREPLERWAW
jgi:hypothetical protein